MDFLNHRITTCINFAEAAYMYIYSFSPNLVVSKEALSYHQH